MMTDQHPLSAAFHTLGCKTNHYETDAILERFRAAGFQIVGFDEPADVYVLNTCTVTAEAGRKSRQFLRRARTANPGALVVAIGCHAQLNPDSQPADIVIGTHGKMAVLDLVLERLGASRRLVSAKLDLEQSKTGFVTVDPNCFEECGPVSHQSESRAYIKIEDGCDNFCSYCAIPMARGCVRSRDPEKVLEETMQLAAAGYLEVVLTGINICSFGADFGLQSHALPELAIRIGNVPGIVRVRFGSLEPQSITPCFAHMAAKVQGLCAHFHLSLQSGSDPVLRLMNRQYDTKLFRESVGLLREQFPDASLTTDIMVGFPGEDESMHRQSLEFIREIGFSRLHVFRYSRRAGTAAAAMANQIPKDVSIRRSSEMQSLSDELARSFHASLIGKTQVILIEQVREDGTATGYTATYVPVIIENAAHLLKNQLVSALPFQFDHEFLYARHANGIISC